MSTRFLTLLLLLLFPALTGFDLSNAVVPENEIRSGGPPKDGIPAILSPRFVVAEKASFLEQEDSIIGIVVDGEARAYPVKILNWHEVVNDEVAGRPLAITY
jgi:hypothetical protein